MAMFEKDIDDMTEEELVNAINDLVDYIFANLDRISTDRLMMLCNKKESMKKLLQDKYDREW